MRCAYPAPGQPITTARGRLPSVRLVLFLHRNRDAWLLDPADRLRQGWLERAESEPIHIEEKPIPRSPSVWKGR